MLSSYMSRPSVGACRSQVAVLSKPLNVTQTTPYDSSWTLAFRSHKFWRNYTAVTINGGVKYRCGRLKSAISDYYLSILYLRNCARQGLTAYFEDHSRLKNYLFRKSYLLHFFLTDCLYGLLPGPFLLSY